jgi:hypothetical protein
VYPVARLRHAAAAEERDHEQERGAHDNDVHRASPDVKTTIMPDGRLSSF